MTWRRVAIAVCATVAALAGAVGVVAGALAPGQDPPRLAGSPGESAPAGDGSSPYRSSSTISLDRLTGSCSPLPAAAAEPPPPAPCDGQVRLPVGASEQEVIRALGEPQSRRTLGAASEAWGYTWQSDGHGLSELATATLRFDGHRLVDASEYLFK